MARTVLRAFSNLLVAGNQTQLAQQVVTMNDPLQHPYQDPQDILGGYEPGFVGAREVLTLESVQYLCQVAHVGPVAFALMRGDVAIDATGKMTTYFGVDGKSGTPPALDPDIYIPGSVFLFSTQAGEMSAHAPYLKIPASELGQGYEGKQSCLPVLLFQPGYNSGGRSVAGREMCIARFKID